MNPHALCLNTGSSSLKFALYDLRDLAKDILSGAAEHIGSRQGRLRVEWNGQECSSATVALPNYEAALQESMAALSRARLPAPSACVHRIVHGGPRLIAPAIITESVKRELESLVILAPLHLPNELVVIEAAARTFPGSIQVACFDTAFHNPMPKIAKQLPLPRALWNEGARRYGFHGLSYEFVVSKLGKELSGRSIIAHLGNGCSMVALKNGIPQDTTMGLTPTGGLMMGTRSGDLDPGALFYLMRQRGPHAQDSVQQAERVVNDESGLLGVSGLSRDMADLQEVARDTLAAQEAIDLFCYCAKKFLGSLHAILGGLDTLVFTGGMGEKSAVVRERICQDLDALGIQIDPSRNRSNASVISRETSPCSVRVIQTNENLVMARHTASLLFQKAVRGTGDET